MFCFLANVVFRFLQKTVICIFCFINEDIKVYRSRVTRKMCKLQECGRKTVFSTSLVEHCYLTCWTSGLHLESYLNWRFSSSSLDLLNQTLYFNKFLRHHMRFILGNSETLELKKNLLKHGRWMEDLKSDSVMAVSAIEWCQFFSELSLYHCFWLIKRLLRIN